MDSDDDELYSTEVPEGGIDFGPDDPEEIDPKPDEVPEDAQWGLCPYCGHAAWLWTIHAVYDGFESRTILLCSKCPGQPLRDD